MGVFGSKFDIRKLEASQDIAGLIRALQSVDTDDRLGAARALANFCPADACPALISCFSDENENVRNAAVNALVATGEATIPLLFNAMGDQSWLVRRGATVALTKLRWKPDDDEIRVCFLFAQGSWAELAEFRKKAIPYLIEGLKDADAGIRKGAAQALGIIGDSDGFEPLTRSLADPDTEVRAMAALSLGKLKDPRAIPFLINLFYDNNAGIRNAAADALGIIGMPAFEPLVSALNDPRTGARLASIRSLGTIRNKKVIQPLILKLEDTFPEIRTSAAVVLGEMGAPALPMVLEVMKRGSRLARLACLDAFAKNLDQTVTDVLVAATEGVDEQIAQKAENVLRKREGLKVWQTSLEEEFESTTSTAELSNIRQERKAFEQIGSQETEKVLSLLRDDDQDSRLRSILQRVNEDRPVVEALIMILKTRDEEIRRRAAEAIDRLEGITGSPFLLTLHENDPFIRSVAARTLGRLGWTDAIIPLIHITCEDKDTYVRGTAEEAITTMGMQPDLKIPVTEVLIRTLTDDSPAIRAQSAELLGALGSAVAIPALIGLFRDRDDTVHERAAEALAEIGRQAFPALVQAVHDPDPRIRSGAMTALAEFGKKGEAYLHEGLKDTNPDVRSHAQKVLTALKHQADFPVTRKASISGILKIPDARPSTSAEGKSAITHQKTVPADPGSFIPHLTSKDDRVRLQAIVSLAALGEPAFRPLIFAAYNPDKEMRIGALQALARFGTMGAPYILKGLKDDEIEVQHAAYRLLNKLDGKYGLPKVGGPGLKVGTPVQTSDEDLAAPKTAGGPMPADERLFPADIIPRLGDSNIHIRDQAVRVLVSMGEPAFLPLVYAAYHPDKTMRIGALQALVRFGTAGARYVIKGLEDDDIAVRNAVYRILMEQDGNYGLPRVGGPGLTSGTPIPAAETTSPAPVAEALPVNVDEIRDPEELAGLLDHQNKEIRVNAAIALSMAGVKAIPALINAFASSNKETRATAAEIISGLGTDSIESLTGALGDPRAGVVEGAASALGMLGDRRAVPVLISLLDKNRNGSGLAAAEALGYLGDPASVEALIRALNGTDNELQSRAARALGYIGDERAVSSLIEALGSEDFSVRRIAIDALTGIGEPAIPYLSGALRHSKRGVRSGAADCFLQMGYVPPTAQEQMNLLVANEEWLELTRRGKPAVETLIHFVDDASGEVRVGAITALGKVGGSRAIETLVGLLTDSDPLVHRMAMSLLAGMGKDALPDLHKARQATTSPIRQQAVDQILERVRRDV